MKCTRVMDLSTRKVCVAHLHDRRARALDGRAYGPEAAGCCSRCVENVAKQVKRLNQSRSESLQLGAVLRAVRRQRKGSNAEAVAVAAKALDLAANAAPKPISGRRRSRSECRFPPLVIDLTISKRRRIATHDREGRVSDEDDEADTEIDERDPSECKVVPSEAQSKLKADPEEASEPAQRDAPAARHDDDQAPSVLPPSLDSFNDDRHRPDRFICNGFFGTRLARLALDSSEEIRALVLDARSFFRYVPVSAGAPLIRHTCSSKCLSQIGVLKSNIFVPNNSRDAELMMQKAKHCIVVHCSAYQFILNGDDRLPDRANFHGVYLVRMRNAAPLVYAQSAGLLRFAEDASERPGDVVRSTQAGTAFGSGRKVQYQPLEKQGQRPQNSHPGDHAVRRRGRIPSPFGRRARVRRIHLSLL